MLYKKESVMGVLSPSGSLENDSESARNVEDTFHCVKREVFS